MRVLLTTCTAQKNPAAERLAPVHRYVHPRVDDAAALSESSGVPLFFFSGHLGLLAADTPIPWYDHALQHHEVDRAAADLAQALQQGGVTHITALLEAASAPGWAPYYAAIQGGCAQARVQLEVQLWPPSGQLEPQS